MRSSFVAATMLLTLAACSSSEDTALLHREITDVQRQIEDLETSTLDKNDLDQMERRMEETSSNTMRSNADLAQRVEQLQEQIEALRASLDITTTKLERITQDLAVSRSQFATGVVLPPVTTADDATAVDGEGAVPVIVPVRSGNTPEELYRTAYEDYMRGNYDLASQGFREYLKQWPGTELSDNALYWIGECHDAQSETLEALEIFNQVLEDYPASDKAAAAQLKKGLLYLKSGDKGQGVINLQYVVMEYPGTAEADLARERLASLGMTIR